MFLEKWRPSWVVGGGELADGCHDSLPRSTKCRLGPFQTSLSVGCKRPKPPELLFLRIPHKFVRYQYLLPVNNGGEEAVESEKRSKEIGFRRNSSEDSKNLE